MRSFLILLSCLFVVGCSSDDPVSPDASIAALVGDWQATRFVVASKANPAQAPELIHDLGAQFTLNVQPSGQYTAVLAYQGTPIPELGTLSMDHGDVVFHVSYPASETNRSRMTVSGKHMTLDGDTEFDFNWDGVAEPATAHIELERR